MDDQNANKNTLGSQAFPSVPIQGSSAPSPEAPSSGTEQTKRQESAVAAEKGGELVQAREISPSAVIEGKKDESSVDKDKPKTDKQFENPYKIYGYVPSQDAYKKAGTSSVAKVTGDTNFARTWLLLLLFRLLKMQSKKTYKPT